MGGVARRAALRLGLPPRYYVPSTSLPPPQPLEQVYAGYPDPQREEAPTWIASAEVRDRLLGDWPVTGTPDEETRTTSSPSSCRRRRSPPGRAAVAAAPPPPPQARCPCSLAVIVARARGPQPTSSSRSASNSPAAASAGGAVVEAFVVEVPGPRSCPRCSRRATRAGMSTRLAERQVALAAVAILAARLRRRRLGRGALRGDRRHRIREGSFTALAGSAGPAVFGRHTACGTVLAADTEGIAHPTLPCGARIFVTYDGKTVLTQVVDRGPYSPGRQFDLTDALARRLGLQGVQPCSGRTAARGWLTERYSPAVARRRSRRRASM